MASCEHLLDLPLLLHLLLFKDVLLLHQLLKSVEILSSDKKNYNKPFTTSDLVFTGCFYVTL